MERAILNRLQHIIPQFPLHIYAYQKGAGTGDNIITLLSLLDGKDSIVVFLDLEKAFELANKDAILSSLAEKGLKGKLLCWLQDYLTDRHAKIRFQGHLSNSYNFENGTPQGGLLSPFLFNILVSNLMTIPFPANVHLLAYADDIQLLATGPNRHVNAQSALDAIESKSKELGLKVNPDKSKALQVNRIVAYHQLYIGNIPLEWVPSYKCLGIFFNSELSATTHLRFLLRSTQSRLNVLRRLTSSKLGAGFKVLRLFYTHAIRSLVDYSAPALLTLKPDQLASLETIQNRAMRTILAAPTWTRLANLRVETYLTSLHNRTQQLSVSLCSKIITSTRPSPLKSITHLLNNQELCHSARWHGQLVKAFHSLNTLQILTARGIDSVHPHYQPNPPWRDWEANIRTDTIPTKKALCTPAMIAQLEANIASLRQPEALLLFTDGSVDQTNGKAGAAFITNGTSVARRVSNGASTLQTELYAIKMALKYALYQTHSTIHIFTDSLSALQVLRRTQATDNLRLISTVLFHIRQLKEQEKILTFWWIPSHVNITGNDLTDTAAKNSLKNLLVTGHIPPSLSQLKKHIRRAAYETLLIEHRAWVIAGSPSASWYKIVTECNPPSLSTISHETPLPSFIDFAWVTAAIGKLTCGFPSLVHCATQSLKNP
ncbi:uncharacterized protein [Penaeus vannamei]|uniref:uncharacterized protein n=1 Tax=Penaeus vannamei TaxID=6689 RepID=UPI00387FA275